MKIGFIDFARYHGRNIKLVGSTQLRVDNVISKDKDFGHWTQGSRWDAYIFQKVYWYEMMEALNKPKILDICDPDWLKLESEGGVDLVRASKLVDAITCSSPTLAEGISKFIKNIPVVHVPDRLDFNLFPDPKKHNEKAKTVVWFGYGHNARKVLDRPEILQCIAEQGYRLLVVSNENFKPTCHDNRTEAPKFKDELYPMDYFDFIAKKFKDQDKIYSELQNVLSSEKLTNLLKEDKFDLVIKPKIEEVEEEEETFDDFKFNGHPLKIENVKYDADNAYYEIQKADICINPFSPTDANFKYKSNNKTIIAWKLGLPVANGPEDLLKFKEPIERKKEAITKLEEVEKNYNVIQSAKQYKELICKLQKKYTNQT